MLGLLRDRRLGDDHGAAAEGGDGERGDQRRAARQAAAGLDVGAAVGAAALPRGHGHAAVGAARGRVRAARRRKRPWVQSNGARRAWTQLAPSAGSVEAGSARLSRAVVSASSRPSIAGSLPSTVSSSDDGIFSSVKRSRTRTSCTASPSTAAASVIARTMSATEMPSALPSCATTEVSGPSPRERPGFLERLRRRGRDGTVVVLVVGRRRRPRRWSRPGRRRPRRARPARRSRSPRRARRRSARRPVARIGVDDLAAAAARAWASRRRRRRPWRPRRRRRRRPRRRLRPWTRR